MVVEDINDVRGYTIYDMTYHDEPKDEEGREGERRERDDGGKGKRRDGDVE